MSPERLLIVCHANVARSVGAAHLLSAAFARRGAAIEIATAGTHATEGQPVSSRTVRSLATALGEPISVSTHRAHQLTDDDVERADLIIAMEAAQVRALRRTHPDAADKVATLGLLAYELPDDDRDLSVRIASMSLADREPDDAEDVTDPAGGDDAAYAATMLALADLCARLDGRLGG